MTTRAILAAAATLALALSGCAAGGIALPTDLAQETEALRLTGMGGWQKGRFQLAGAEGSFSRSLGSSSSLDGLQVRRRGTARFLHAGISGDCRVSERQLRVGSFEVTERPFSFHCDLRRGADSGQLVIEAQPGTTMETFGREARIGFVELGGTRLILRSVHRLEGARTVPAMSPLGYTLEMDGRAVGAVDLAGPRTLHVPRTGPARDAAMAAGVALSVLWDPARM